MRLFGRFGAGAVVAALFVGALGACGGDDSDVPDGAVAVVGQEEITHDQLDDRVTVLRQAQDVPASSGQGGDTGDQQQTPSDKTLERQALATLLQAAALEQEAAARDIEVTDAEVRARWEAAAGKQFRSKKALRRFLRGQSEDDLLDQLRLQVLSERILADVSEAAGGGKDSQRAVKQFQKKFQKRWREQTTCAEAQQDLSICG